MTPWAHDLYSSTTTLFLTNKTGQFNKTMFDTPRVGQAGHMVGLKVRMSFIHSLSVQWGILIHLKGRVKGFMCKWEK